MEKHISSRMLRGALGRRRRNHDLVSAGTVFGNLRAPAYRVGEELRWFTDDPRRERVILGIDPECWLRKDVDGEVLISRGRCPAWFELTHAAWLGWCWEATADTTGRRRLAGYVAGEQLFSRPSPSSLRLPLWLADGARFVETATGEYQFMRGECAQELPLRNALQAGWCQVPNAYRDRLEAHLHQGQVTVSLVHENLTGWVIAHHRRPCRRSRQTIEASPSLITAEG